MTTIARNHRRGRHAPRRPRCSRPRRTRRTSRRGELPDDARGLSAAAGWLECFGTLELVGVEGTGSYGAGLTRHLLPTRSRSSRSTGPTASAAGARASPIPKTPWRRPGRPKAARRRARPRRETETSRPCGCCASLGFGPAQSDPGPQPDAQPHLDRPDGLRSELRDLSIYQFSPGQCLSAHRADRRNDDDQAHPCARWRAGPSPSKRRSKRSTGCLRPSSPRPHRNCAPSTGWAPTLLRPSWSPPATTPSAQERSDLRQALRVSPLDASSGKQERHRLNRGGDRQANSALWHIVFTRMVKDPRTRHYIERRMKDGRTKKEAIRCLKRYVAREVFVALPRSQFALDNP